MHDIPEKPDFGPFQTADLVDDLWVVRDMTTDELAEKFPLAEAIPPEMPPVADQPVPAGTLTFAQLLIGLVERKWISEAEGDAWLTGTLPQAVLDAIADVPQEYRFRAKARALHPSTVLRNDPLVIALAASQGKSPDQLDTFFKIYAQV